MIYLIMEGASRVFAGEFGQSTLLVPADEPGNPGWVVTPGGAWCRQLYLAGALTEVTETGDLIHCRIADPTGAFDVVAGSRNAVLAGALRKIPVPSFVGVLGQAQFFQRRGAVQLSVRMDHIHNMDRVTRDKMVLTTAGYTLTRLEEMNRAIKGESTDSWILRAHRHYGISAGQLESLLQRTESAVLGIRPPQDAGPAQPPADVRAMVMEVMQASAGPRGIAVEEIIDTLALRGIAKEAVLSALEALIVDDECYQPQKGYVRPL
jgi:RPA family protein